MQSKKPIPDDVKPKLAKQILAYTRARGIAKGAYVRADLLLDHIVKVLPVNQEFELPSGKVAILRDQFASKNKVFRSHGIHRYELELKNKEDLLF